MITIYSANETDFTHNGLGVLMPIRCVVPESINGKFVLAMEHPIDPDGKWSLIAEENNIRAGTPKGNQLFRIHTVLKSMDNTLLVNANHISYDLLDNMIEDRAPTDCIAAQALAVALENTLFSGTSDVEGVASARWIRKNPIEAIMSDEENSILNRWGGEVERDNFEINILQQLGEDRGVAIRYRKNLTGLEAETSIDGVKTRILPTGLKEDGQTVLELPEVYVDSPLIGNYHAPKIVHRHYGDIRVGEEYPTEEAAQEALRARAASKFEAGLDKPSVSMSVNFIDLSKTMEYAGYQVLERVYLGDTVRVIHEPLGIEVSIRVVAYTWDSILDRYIEIQVGQPVPSIEQSINEQAAQMKQIPIIQETQAAIQTAFSIMTALINAPGSSYVRFYPSIANCSEIYVMDAEDPMAAEKITRLNSQGLGMSSTGINGPYTTILTAGLGIAAEAIIVGTIRAAVTFAGVLEGVSGSFTNLITGDPEHAHMKHGTDDNGEPYIRTFDYYKTPKLSLDMDEITYPNGTRLAEFSIGGTYGVGLF